MHPTAESDFAVLLSQTVYRGVRIKHFAGIWLLWKEQSGKILLLVSTSIMGEKNSKYKKFGFSKPKILIHRCKAHWGVSIFELTERISQWNRNWIRKYLACLSGAWMRSNHEKIWVGDSIIGFLSKSLIFCDRQSKWGIRSRLLFCIERRGRIASIDL